VDIVGRCADGASQALAGLLCLQGAHLELDQCSLSLSEPSKQRRSLIRFEGSEQDEAARRCRMTRCLLRGTSSVAIALKDITLELLCEQSLLLADTLPVIDLLGNDKLPPVRFQLRGCTLAAGKAALRVQGPKASDAAPQFEWQGTDTVIT